MKSKCKEQFRKILKDVFNEEVSDEKTLDEIAKDFLGENSKAKEVKKVSFRLDDDFYREIFKGSFKR